ncbi:MAG: hypothetical protein ACRD4B_04190, partial [Acidobacteriota bacterium]
ADTWMPWNGGRVIKGGTVISAIATKEYWIGINKTKRTPSETKRYRDLDRNDRSIVRSELFSSGLEGTEVLFYTIKGGGHSMPSIKHRIGALIQRIVGTQNHDIEIAQEAWNFLSPHSL